MLTILFLLSYGLLTMLVVEQGRTIDSQRNLIHLLFSDSVQLSSIKGKAAQKQNDARAEAQAQAQKNLLRCTSRRLARKIRARAKPDDRFRRSRRRKPLTRETIAGF